MTTPSPVPNPDVLVSVCSYCCNQLGTKTGFPGSGIALSHGICPKCLAKVESGAELVWLTPARKPPKVEVQP